MMTTLTSSRSF